MNNMSEFTTRVQYTEFYSIVDNGKARLQIVNFTGTNVNLQLLIMGSDNVEGAIELHMELGHQVRYHGNDVTLVTDVNTMYPEFGEVIEHLGFSELEFLEYIIETSESTMVEPIDSICITSIIYRV